MAEHGTLKAAYDEAMSQLFAGNSAGFGALFTDDAAINLSGHQLTGGHSFAKAATLMCEKAGWIGELHPRLQRELGLDMPVLGFEIERQTPFAADAVLHDGRLLGERSDGSLQAELVVVPRQRFDAVAARLGGAGKRLAGIDLADADGQALGVNLLPPAQRYRRRNPWLVLNLILAVVAVLALTLGLHQILANRRDAATELQATIRHRQAQAQGISAARQRVVDSVEGEQFLRGLRNQRPSSVEVMESLAQRIPDGTYLEKLSIEGRQLTLVGLSTQAAALVSELGDAPQWSSAALSGALQTDPRMRMDRFTVVAQLSQGAAPAIAPTTQPGGAREAR